MTKNVVMGTNYEYNQQMYRQNVSPLTDQEINTELANVGAWFSFLPDLKYAMLLCNERHDYTIINIHNYNYTAAVQEIKETIENRGEILDIRYVSRDERSEIWVRERRSEAIDEIEKTSTYKWTPQIWCFMLFDATSFVIEAGADG